MNWVRFCLIMPIWLIGAYCQAQDLREMDIQRLPNPPLVVFADYPNYAAVQIESSIRGLRVESNIGIEADLSDPSVGAYKIILKPGRQTLSFNAPGFLVANFVTDNMEARSVLHLRIVSKSVVITDKGSFEITTEPSRANLQIEGLPGVFQTPYKADGIFALAYNVIVTLDGYVDRRFVLEIKANQTTMRHIVLLPITSSIDTRDSNKILVDSALAKTLPEKEAVTIPPIVEPEIVATESASWQCGDRVIDVDGNAYATTKIGDLCWMTENLRASRYATGSQIAHVTNDILWNDMNAGAWSHYQNSSTFDEQYGKLYNWHAVTNPNQLCPATWYVPSDKDWTNLINILNRQDSGTKGTQRFRLSAAAEAGFYIQSGGYRLSNGAFHYMGSIGHWWTSSGHLPGTGWTREIMTRRGTIKRHNYLKNNGLSVRCVTNL